jgi:acetyl esterase
MAADPETMQFNRELEQLLHQYPSLTDLTPAEARRLREEGRSAFGPVVRSEKATDTTILGSLRARLFVPDNPRGAYLHIHGGGWVLGATHHQDPRLEALSEACGLAVISVDYRLAPEHPYPAGLDDCEQAALWLIENSHQRFGTSRLFIGGESAGAHLAVTTLLRLRDRHGLTPFAGANLVYGIYDLRLTPSARAWGDRLLVLNTPIIEWFVNHYTAGFGLDAPDVSPLLADLRGMPPALFTVGTEDPLLDDTLLMSRLWREAGCSAELEVYPGGAHGFDAFPIAIGRQALRRMWDFLNAR